jgi:hypothetical protein
MNIPPPAGHQSPEQAPVPVQPGFEEAAQAFWEKNRQLVLIACAAALLIVVGREGWHYYNAQRQLSIRADFAKAGDRVEQLTAFAKANEGHTLAGLAYLRIADQRYTAGDHRQAQENYTKATAVITDPALRGRARIGAALSLLSAGDKAGAETALKAISADAALLKVVRAEATYHLASLALEAGNFAEVDRLVAEIGKIDPAGMWSQRATALVANQRAI